MLPTTKISCGSNGYLADRSSLSRFLFFPAALVDICPVDRGLVNSGIGLSIRSDRKNLVNRAFSILLDLRGDPPILLFKVLFTSKAKMPYMAQTLQV